METQKKGLNETPKTNVKTLTFFISFCNATSDWIMSSICDSAVVHYNEDNHIQNFIWGDISLDIW